MDAGKVFVFDDEAGDDFASFTLPPYVHSRIMAFRVRGPFQPAIPGESQQLESLTQWITGFNRMGFVFVLDEAYFPQWSMKGKRRAGARAGFPLARNNGLAPARRVKSALSPRPLSSSFKSWEAVRAAGRERRGGSSNASPKRWRLLFDRLELANQCRTNRTVRRMPRHRQR
jgi:hypothetical protein